MSRSVNCLAASSARSRFPPKLDTFSFNHPTNSSPVKESWYSPSNGKRTGLNGSSACARNKSCETAEGGKGSPASITGAWPAADEMSALGGKVGDMGAGEIIIGEGGRSSTALPLPLSILGALSSVSVSDPAVGSSGDRVFVFFFWSTFRRSAIRSLTLALR